MKKLLIILPLLYVVSGCSDRTKNILDLKNSGPDESQIKSSKALEVPPWYNKENENNKTTLKK